MITEKDLQEAIAECLGQKDPNANTCIKLAAYYTIMNELYPDERTDDQAPARGYSYASGAVNVDPESEFLSAVNGKAWEDVLPVLDELMVSVQVIVPRLYNAVLGKLKDL